MIKQTRGDSGGRVNKEGTHTHGSAFGSVGVRVGPLFLRAELHFGRRQRVGVDARPPLAPRFGSLALAGGENNTPGRQTQRRLKCILITRSESTNVFVAVPLTH